MKGWCRKGLQPLMKSDGSLFWLPAFQCHCEEQSDEAIPGVEPIPLGSLL